MSKDSDTLAAMLSNNIPQLDSDAVQEVAVALAFGNYVVDAAIDKSVIVVWVSLFRFVKGQAFEHADISFAKGGIRADLKAEQSGKRLCRLHSPQQIARVYRIDIFLCQCLGGNSRLLKSKLRKRSRAMPAKPPLDVSGRLSVSD